MPSKPRVVSDTREVRGYGAVYNVHGPLRNSGHGRTPERSRMFRLIPALLVGCMLGGCVSANQHVALREAYDRVLAEKQQATKDKAELTREKADVTRELESAKAELAAR